MKKYYYTITTIIFLGLLSCSNEETKTQNQVVARPTIPILDNRPRDIDGNVYSVVTIGTQKWFRSNLNVSHYRNGDPIPQVTNAYEWESLTTGAWCYYENNSYYGARYGKLYNWYAVNDPRGLAPIGWHVPSVVEWTSLITFLGGANVAGGKMKRRTDFEYGGWASPNEGATNSSGFTGIPGGCRPDYVGSFNSNTLRGYWWTSTADSPSSAWNRSLFYNSASVGSTAMYGIDKAAGFSVRCLRD